MSYIFVERLGKEAKQLLSLKYWEHSCSMLCGSSRASEWSHQQRCETSRHCYLRQDLRSCLGELLRVGEQREL